jgi:hypothetical protein
MSTSAPPPPATAPKPPPPPAQKPPPPSNGLAPKPVANGKKFSVSSGATIAAQRIAIYGPGGIGKTSLAAAIKQIGIEPLYLDIGDGSRFLDVKRIGPDQGLSTWEDLRACLHDHSLFAGYGAVVIDDSTKAEELAAKWTVANIKNDKGVYVSSIEGYGFGKGLGHLYETYLQLFGDLDAHIRAGRHVILICHECTANVPNPSGEDWIRYEPRLQSPTSGKNSIRHRLKEWVDHLLFVGLDTFVSEDGKGQGGGSRTIYANELPTHWAKSRSLSVPIPYERDSADLWRQLFGDKS